MEKERSPKNILRENLVRPRIRRKRELKSSGVLLYVVGKIVSDVLDYIFSSTSGSNSPRKYESSA
jgi:hypothetical protein